MKKIIILNVLFLSIMQIDASSKKNSTPKKKSKSSAQQKPESQEQKKMIQGFIQAVEAIPVKKSNQTNYKEKIKKMFEAYEKMSKIPKETSITKTEKKDLQKAAQKLFDNKITYKNSKSTQKNSSSKKK